MAYTDEASVTPTPGAEADESADTISVTTFDWVPEFARGIVRDLRVRWALEEAGMDYVVDTIDFQLAKQPNYMRLQPFGQVPVYADDSVCLFESGAIVLHIAERCETLLPAAALPRKRAISWVFAALNSIEPSVQQLAEIDLFHRGEAWTTERRPQVEAMARQRLAHLAAWLDGRSFLEDEFTVGDLMMVSVLRILRTASLVAEQPVLAAYQARCEARPAFQVALAAQQDLYDQSSAPAV